jgi:hypothetical protein
MLYRSGTPVDVSQGMIEPRELVKPRIILIANPIPSLLTPSPKHTEPQPQPSPNKPANITLRVLQVIRASTRWGTVVKARTAGRTRKPRKQNANHMFSHSHFEVIFTGATKLACMTPAAAMKSKALRSTSLIPHTYARKNFKRI